MTAPDLSQRLTETKARAERATKGPWRSMQAGNSTMEDGLLDHIAEVEGLQRPWEPTWVGWKAAKNHFKSFFRQRDAEFIAHAREDVPFLLEQLAAQSLALEEAHRQLTDAIRHRDEARREVNAERLEVISAIAWKEGTQRQLVAALTRGEAAEAQRAEARQQIAELELDAKDNRDERIAIQMFLSGRPLAVSTGIDDLPTHGYGKLDSNGFWEFMVPEWLVNLKREKKSVEARLAVLREALTTYGQCVKTCASKRCANCDQYAWLHDAAEDIDEVACIQRDEQFTPNPCNCGFTALLQASPAYDDPSLLLTKSPKGEPEPGQ